MKVKSIIAVTSIVLVLAIILIALVFIWKKPKSLKDVGSKDENKVLNVLISEEWVGLNIEMPGLKCTVNEKFEGGLKLFFRENGTYELLMGEQILSGKWKIKDDQLYIRGEGINTQAYLENNFSKSKAPYLYFIDIHSYSVTFQTQKHLDELPAKISKYEQRREREMQAWLATLEVDLSTCTPDFKGLLKTFRFEEFEPIQLKEEEKDDFIAEYFSPILSLGLQYTSWVYGYSLDADRILDGYEVYEFNLKMDPSERELKAGDAVIVPIEELEAYIALHLLIYDDSDGTIVKEPLREMLWDSERFDRETEGLRMKISKELDVDFEVKLLEVWHHDLYGGQLVIHVLYGDGDKDEDHAWFFLRNNTYMDQYYYLGGSAFEPVD